MHPSAKMITAPVTNTNRPTHRQTKASEAAAAAVDDRVVISNSLSQDTTINKRWKVEALIAIRYMCIHLYMCVRVDLPTYLVLVAAWRRRWKVEALIAIRYKWIYVYMCGWICVPTLFSWQHGGVGGRGRL